MVRQKCSGIRRSYLVTATATNLSFIVNNPYNFLGVIPEPLSIESFNQWQAIFKLRSSINSIISFM